MIQFQELHTLEWATVMRGSSSGLFNGRRDAAARHMECGGARCLNKHPASGIYTPNSDSCTSCPTFNARTALEGVPVCVET
jgi:hypothetical protein